VRCPFCSHIESKVTDSRLSAVGDVTRRRRECEKCARRFTTYERVEEVLPLVVKKDGRREMFDRVKLLGGLRRACDKRSIGIERLEQIVDAVERDLMDGGEKEIRAQAIGEKVMHHLRTLDDIAYVRFASVYRSFRDIEEFRAELEKIAQDREAGRKNGSPPSDPVPPSRPTPSGNGAKDTPS
jgi:transcriptional repressor NrdR